MHAAARLLARAMTALIVVTAAALGGVVLVDFATPCEASTFCGG